MLCFNLTLLQSLSLLLTPARSPMTGLRVKSTRCTSSISSMALPNSRTFDLNLGLSRTHVLVTGGYGMIGKIVVQAFLAAGGHVTVLDINDRSPFDVEDDEKIFYVKTDIANAEQVEAAFNSAEARFGPVLTCVALASLDLSVLSQCESLADMEPTTWQRVFDVNINGTFNTCRSWLRSVRRAVSHPGEAVNLRNVCLIIMGSESGRFGVRTMAAYAAGKSAVQ